MSLKLEGSALCEARLLNATAAGRQPLVDGLQFSMARRLQQERLLSGPPAKPCNRWSQVALLPKDISEVLTQKHVCVRPSCGCPRAHISRPVGAVVPARHDCVAFHYHAPEQQPSKHVGVLESCLHLSEAELDTHPIGTSPRASASSACSTG